MLKTKKGTLLVFGEDGRFISNSANKIGNGKEEYSILLAYTMVSICKPFCISMF